MLSQLNLFGEAVLESPTGRVVLKGGKNAALLVYLALHGGWVRREAAMVVFWPEASEKTARANLRQLLVGLRRSPHVMGTGAGLEVTGAALRWRVPTDVAAFRERLAAGDMAGAAATYREELLGAFNLGGLGDFVEWLEAEREALGRAFRETALTRAHGYRQTGAFAEAADVLGLVLRRDPLDEDVLCERLEALLHARRFRPALAEVAAFCKRLGREFGGVPGPALRDLEARLRAEGAKGAAEPLPVASALPTSLVSPPPATSPVSPFVGRARELELLRAHLADPACRLVSLVGPGGVGKTRLALELAAQDGAFRDGVTVARLETLTDPALVAPALAALLGVPPSAEPFEEQVTAHLAERECLIVLDNLEQLLECGPFLSALLVRAPGVRLLVTTREPLGAAHETVLELRGLALGDGADAATLFAHGAARAGATLRPEDGALVADICALLEGTPLALELTSAWLRLLSPAEVKAELTGGLDLLAWPDTGLPERHRNMRRVLTGSWERLNEAEQRGLARLSVFRGGFAFTAAKTATGLSPNALLTLLRRSLVYRDADGRFFLHELVRHYAGERLIQTGTEARVRAEHARYYLGLLGGLEMWSEKEPLSLATLDTELPNVRAAWEYAATGGYLPEFWRPNDVVIFFDRRMRYAEGLELLTAASRCFDPADEAHRETLAALAVDRAWLLFRLSRFEEAEAAAQRGLEGTADLKIRMKASNTLGIIARQQGRYEVAATHIEAALAWAHKLGDTVRVAAYLNNLGATCIYLGDYARAEKATRTALSLHRAADDAYGVVNTLLDLSDICSCQNAFGQALDAVDEALELARGHAFGDVTPVLLLMKARALYRLGDLRHAELVGHKALDLMKEAGRVWEKAMVLNLLGRVALRHNEAEKARRYLLQGFLLAWRHKDTPTILESMVAVAELELSENEHKRAYRLLDAAANHPAKPAADRQDAKKLLGALKNLTQYSARNPGETTATSLEQWVPAFFGLEGEALTKLEVS